MGIEPFFRDELLLRDDLPDTRKDVVTIRPDDDLYPVDTPPTYAMGLAERLAALHPDAYPSSLDISLRADDLETTFDSTTVTLEDFDLTNPLEDFDPDATFDRETLPSAPYPPAILDDGAAGRTWDVHPPPVPTFPDSADLPWENSSEPPPAKDSRPSLWGKLQRFVSGIGQSRSQPPASSSASSRRLSQRALFEFVWSLDNASLESLGGHIERILAVRRLGPEAYAESRIVDLLDNLHATERGFSEGIVISTLRGRIPEVTRAMFDHALLRLENRGVVELLPEDPGHDGILDPVRGHLNRCVLLQPSS